MLSMSSVADGYLGIFRKYSAAILKENLPMHVPCFIKEHLWMSASDEVTLKKVFGRSKLSSKLTKKVT